MGGWKDEDCMGGHRSTYPRSRKRQQLEVWWMELHLLKQLPWAHNDAGNEGWRRTSKKLMVITVLV